MSDESKHRKRAMANEARRKRRADPECRGRERAEARQRRAADPEKARAKELRWREQHRDEIAAKARADYKADPGKNRAASRKWRRANPEKAKASDAAQTARQRERRLRMSKEELTALRLKQREQRSAPEKKEAARLRAAKWNADNPQRAIASSRRRRAADPEGNRRRVRAWVAANPGKRLVQHHVRRARKLNATGRHTAADIANLLKLQQGRCASPWCRADISKRRHVDHIIPLAKGGSDCKRNLQLLCKPCNLSKHAKHPIDFAQENGLLL